MSVFPDIPVEGTYLDIELDLADNEPPGLLPTDQTSYWGQLRRVFADNLQVLADQMEQWYLNLDPRTVNADDMPEWEYLENIPTSPAGKTLDDRRAFVLSRNGRGAFTRTRRRVLVESFIAAVFGVPPLALVVGGVPFTDDGFTLGGEFTLADLQALYEIVEDIPGFAYTVNILDTVGEDTDGLTRELYRITPAGITFTIEHVSMLP